MKTLLLISLMFIFGCSANAIHISDSDSTWIEFGFGKQFYPYWCTTKDKDGKLEKPTCYEAEIKQNRAR